MESWPLARYSSAAAFLSSISELTTRAKSSSVSCRLATSVGPETGHDLDVVSGTASALPMAPSVVRNTVIASWFAPFQGLGEVGGNPLSDALSHGRANARPDCGGRSANTGDPQPSGPHHHHDGRSAEHGGGPDEEPHVQPLERLVEEQRHHGHHNESRQLLDGDGDSNGGQPEREPLG